MDSNVQFEIVSDEIAAEDIPQPVGWRILVEPIRVEEKTTGGIVLPGQAIEAKEHLRYIGKVIAMGPLCYKHSKFEGCEPWCAVGDWIAYGQYTGHEIRVRTKNGNKTVLRIVNDDTIQCKVGNPKAIVNYV